MSMDAANQVEGVRWAASQPAPAIDAFVVAKKIEAVRIQAERDGGLSERDALALCDAVEKALCALGSKAEAMRDQVTLAKATLAREARGAQGAA